MACGLSVTCPVANIRTNIHQRGIYAKIYEQIIETYNGDDIFGIQLIPDGWPKVLRINLRNEDIRDTMLVQGIVMFGTTVTFKNDDSLFTKVTVKDGEMEWNEEKMKELFIEYGEIARVEREYIYFKGERTDITTGTWYIYFQKLTAPIPRRRDFKIDGLIYTLQMFHSGQNSSDSVSQANTTTNQSDGKGYCGMCGETDHRTSECQHKKAVCFTCKQDDHTTKDCPINDGVKLNDNALIFYNARCPLSNWSTEYPFRANSKEYICVEQFIQEEKCYMFGDTATAKKVMEETEPRKMRDITKYVQNYNHYTWLDNVEAVMYNGMKYRFSDTQARGAREYLMSTKDLTIGEATRNTTWGIGFHVSESNATDPSKWTGANLTGLMLMDIRDKIKKQAQQPVSTSSHVQNPPAEKTSDSDSQLPAATPPLPTLPPDVSDSESSTSASAATEIVQPNSFLEEVQQQTAEEVDLSRVVVVFGDHNTVNLPLSTSELPVSTVVCSLGGSTLSEIRQKVKDGHLDLGIDESKVTMVVLHLGSHEWDFSDNMVRSADSVMVDFEKLMNELSTRFSQLSDIVISGIPLFKFDEPTETEIQINGETVKTNRKLFELSNTDACVHFLTNEDDLHIDPGLENLHAGPNTFNDKGRAILADNIKIGISDSIGRSMVQSGLQKCDWYKKA